MIKEQLKKDMIAALKAGNQLKRIVLGTLLAAIKNKELAKRGRLASSGADPGELNETSPLHDEEVLEVVIGEVKKRKDSLKQFEAAKRDDLAKKEADEMAILLTYLPQSLTAEEVELEVVTLIKELGATGLQDVGRVIKAAMAKLKGRVDGGALSKRIKEILAD